MGIRGYQWWGPHGFEGSAKLGVATLNQTAERTQPIDFEARYHYRINTPFPFGFARELQSSAFIGYEFYRNNGSSFYTNKYDLLKLGRPSCSW
jgi:hypothetical protein